MSSLSKWKFPTKFYESYRSLINYQINSNIKDKIKTNVHFAIRLKSMNKKDKTNYKLQLHNVDSNKREDIQMVQHS